MSHLAKNLSGVLDTQVEIMEDSTDLKTYRLITRDCPAVEIDDIANKVILVINVTSKDERAKDVFAVLTKLTKKFDSTRLRVLCFPCSQFGSPVSREDVVAFTKQWGFDIGEVFDTTDVKGNKSSELFRYLKDMTTSTLGNAITDNFTMFLIDRKGTVRKRLPVSTSLLALDHFILQVM